MIDKFICAKHILDKDVKEYIIRNGKKEDCTYCDNKKISVSISDLASYIEECVEHEYDDPYSRGAPYNKEAVYYEDRFPGVDVQYTEHILEELLEVEDFQIIEDLSQEFGNGFWTKIDGIWGPTRIEYLSRGWESFKQILKHQVRFLFFNKKLNHDFDNEHGESINPHYVLDEFGNAVIDLNLVSTFPQKKLKIYRGRQHEKDEILSSAHQLGSPPPIFAKANRMSPAGISMFYGAFDTETCKQEIVNKDWKDSKITIGEFTNLNDLTLIDFTKFQIPSLFNVENRDKRDVAKFIFSFLRDFSTPVKPDDSVHIDYVPTQVVTEYLKIIKGREMNIDGIIYNSVKNSGEKCVVLFFENNEMVDSKEIDDTFKIGSLELTKTQIFEI